MEERERLFNVLRSIDYLEPFPSQANFILCKVIIIFRCTRPHRHSLQQGLPIHHISSLKASECTAIVEAIAAVTKATHVDTISPSMRGEPSVMGPE